MSRDMDSKNTFTYEDVEMIANHILEKVKCRPKLGIICGSGLGKLVDLVEDKEVLPYQEIPGFPVSTVPGHEGKLVFGQLRGKSVVLMQGRAHCYEGYTPQKITLPVRTMKMMGITTLFVTNAAGGVNKKYNIGDIMIIKDHVNLAGFAGVNPLVGVNDEKFGPRFPAMSNAYDLGLRQLALAKAKEIGFSDFVREGVYSMMVGPNFETVTECKILSLLLVDATGMSTIPEVLVAKHCGMRVFGMSLITNVVISEYDSPAHANHQEVLETGERRSKDLQQLVAAIVADLDL
ncbi:purine nucleoside phosphorylase isoform X2 [Aplysia californica]|uniref:Purine nucleoside phosphorylase n=1 Tax=Aplysia californica TaxID=6500 RepID=A0ABM0JLF9_APLCA|nr:purine nucleoside phosphorylase isoform X2 [Aplysia californica]XP_005096473.1 purine nucleoside phosphorylase isoform X2 [Aplysia californica]XP_035825126.1 purine nucleoside phosphorylase isoform X2 [Aplysia californica]